MDDNRRMGAQVPTDAVSRNAAEGHDFPAFLPDTPRARRLWELRKAVIASGLPLLDDEGLAREIAERRGGVAATLDDN